MISLHVGYELGGAAVAAAEHPSYKCIRFIMCPRYKEKKEKKKKGGGMATTRRGERESELLSAARDRETRLRINPLDITLIFFLFFPSFFPYSTRIEPSRVESSLEHSGWSNAAPAPRSTPQTYSLITRAMNGFLVLVLWLRHTTILSLTTPLLKLRPTDRPTGRPPASARGCGNSLIPSYTTPRRSSSSSSSNDSPCSKMLLCLCAASVNVSSSSGSSSLYRHHSITINQFRLFTRTNATAWAIVIMTSACTAHRTTHKKSTVAQLKSGESRSQQPRASRSSSEGKREGSNG